MTGIAIDEKLLPVINEAEESLWQSLQLFIPVEGVRCRIRPDAVASPTTVRRGRVRHRWKLIVPSTMVPPPLLEYLRDDFSARKLPKHGYGHTPGESKIPRHCV